MELKKITSNPVKIYYSGSVNVNESISNYQEVGASNFHNVSNNTPNLSLIVKNNENDLISNPRHNALSSKSKKIRQYKIRFAYAYSSDENSDEIDPKIVRLQRLDQATTHSDHEFIGNKLKPIMSKIVHRLVHEYKQSKRNIVLNEIDETKAVKTYTLSMTSDVNTKKNYFKKFVRKNSKNKKEITANLINSYHSNEKLHDPNNENDLVKRIYYRNKLRKVKKLRKIQSRHFYDVDEDDDNLNAFDNLIIEAPLNKFVYFEQVKDIFLMKPLKYVHNLNLDLHNMLNNCEPTVCSQTKFLSTDLKFILFFTSILYSTSNDVMSKSKVAIVPSYYRNIHQVKTISYEIPKIIAIDNSDTSCDFCYSIVDITKSLNYLADVRVAHYNSSNDNLDNTKSGSETSENLNAHLRKLSRLIEGNKHDPIIGSCNILQGIKQTSVINQSTSSGVNLNKQRDSVSDSEEFSVFDECPICHGDPVICMEAEGRKSLINRYVTILERAEGIMIKRNTQNDIDIEDLKDIIYNFMEKHNLYPSQRVKENIQAKRTFSPGGTENTEVLDEESKNKLTEAFTMKTKSHSDEFLSTKKVSHEFESEDEMKNTKFQRRSRVSFSSDINKIKQIKKTASDDNINSLKSDNIEVKLKKISSNSTNDKSDVVMRQMTPIISEKVFYETGPNGKLVKSVVRTSKTSAIYKNSDDNRIIKPSNKINQLNNESPINSLKTPEDVRFRSSGKFPAKSVKRITTTKTSYIVSTSPSSKQIFPPSSITESKDTIKRPPNTESGLTNIDFEKALNYKVNNGISQRNESDQLLSFNSGKTASNTSKDEKDDILLMNSYDNFPNFDETTSILLMNTTRELLNSISTDIIRDLLIILATETARESLKFKKKNSFEMNHLKEDNDLIASGSKENEIQKPESQKPDEDLIETVLNKLDENISQQMHYNDEVKEDYPNVIKEMKQHEGLTTKDMTTLQIPENKIDNKLNKKSNNIDDVDKMVATQSQPNDLDRENIVQSSTMGTESGVANNVMQKMLNNELDSRDNINGEIYENKLVASKPYNMDSKLEEGKDPGMGKERLVYFNEEENIIFENEKKSSNSLIRQNYEKDRDSKNPTEIDMNNRGKTENMPSISDDAIRQQIDATKGKIEATRDTENDSKNFKVSSLEHDTADGLTLPQIEEDSFSSLNLKLKEKINQAQSGTQLNSGGIKENDEILYDSNLMVGKGDKSNQNEQDYKMKKTAINMSSNQDIFVEVEVNDLKNGIQLDHLGAPDNLLDWKPTPTVSTKPALSSSLTKLTEEVSSSYTETTSTQDTSFELSSNNDYSPDYERVFHNLSMENKNDLVSVLKNVDRITGKIGNKEATESKGGLQEALSRRKSSKSNSFGIKNITSSIVANKKDVNVEHSKSNLDDFSLTESFNDQMELKNKKSGGERFSIGSRSLTKEDYGVIRGSVRRESPENQEQKAKVNENDRKGEKRLSDLSGGLGNGNPLNPESGLRKRNSKEATLENLASNQIDKRNELSERLKNKESKREHDPLSPNDFNRALGNSTKLREHKDSHSGSSINFKKTGTNDTLNEIKYDDDFGSRKANLKDNKMEYFVKVEDKFDRVGNIPNDQRLDENRRLSSSSDRRVNAPINSLRTRTRSDKSDIIKRQNSKSILANDKTEEDKKNGKFDRPASVQNGKNDIMERTSQHTSELGKGRYSFPRKSNSLKEGKRLSEISNETKRSSGNYKNVLNKNQMPKSTTPVNPRLSTKMEDRNSTKQSLNSFSKADKGKIFPKSDLKQTKELRAETEKLKKMDGFEVENERNIEQIKLEKYREVDSLNSKNEMFYQLGWNAKGRSGKLNAVGNEMMGMESKNEESLKNKGENAALYNTDDTKSKKSINQPDKHVESLINRHSSGQNVIHDKIISSPNKSTKSSNQGSETSSDVNEEELDQNVELEQTNKSSEKEKYATLNEAESQGKNGKNNKNLNEQQPYNSGSQKLASSTRRKSRSVDRKSKNSIKSKPKEDNSHGSNLKKSVTDSGKNLLNKSKHSFSDSGRNIGKESKKNSSTRRRSKSRTSNKSGKNPERSFSDSNQKRLRRSGSQADVGSIQNLTPKSKSQITEMIGKLQNVLEKSEHYLKSLTENAKQIKRNPSYQQSDTVNVPKQMLELIRQMCLQKNSQTSFEDDKMDEICQFLYDLESKNILTPETKVSVGNQSTRTQNDLCSVLKDLNQLILEHCHGDDMFKSNRQLPKKNVWNEIIDCILQKLLDNLKYATESSDYNDDISDEEYSRNMSDPRPWSVQKQTDTFSTQSHLNRHKLPLYRRNPLSNGRKRKIKRIPRVTSLLDECLSNKTRQMMSEPGSRNQVKAGLEVCDEIVDRLNKLLTSVKMSQKSVRDEMPNAQRHLRTSTAPKPMRLSNDYEYLPKKRHLKSRNRSISAHNGDYSFHKARYSKRKHNGCVGRHTVSSIQNISPSHKIAMEAVLGRRNLRREIHDKSQRTFINSKLRLKQLLPDKNNNQPKPHNELRVKLYKIK